MFLNAIVDLKILLMMILILSAAGGSIAKFESKYRILKYA